MNDVELVKRLERELASRPRWPDVERVASAKSDSSLADNELLVFPRPKSAGDGAVEVLRVVVEHLSLPSVPEGKCSAD